MKKWKRMLLLLVAGVLLLPVLVACNGDGNNDDGDMMDEDAGMMDDGDMMDDDADMIEDEDSSAMGMDGAGGTAWGDGAFAGNGERIYFTGTSERRGDIDYTGGPDIGGMMMGGQLACASCHGPNARGGRHQMHMETVDAPNIRWDALAGHGGDGEDEHAGEEDEHTEAEGAYDLETFRLAVVEGQHPDGEPLSEEMPRWEMRDADLRDLAAYLQSLEGE